MSAIHLGEVTVCLCADYTSPHVHVCVHNSISIRVYAWACVSTISHVPEQAERSAGNNRDENNNKLTGMEEVHIHVF